MRTNEVSYEDVYIIRHLNGERNFKTERDVFHYYETEELMGERDTNRLLSEYCEAAKLTYEESSDITTIQINVLDLDNEIDRLRDEVISQSKQLGADDDTFDYFPDLVYAFKQICVRYNKKEVYDTLIAHLNKQIYDELGEPFEYLIDVHTEATK